VALRLELNQSIKPLVRLGLRPKRGAYEDAVADEVNANAVGQDLKPARARDA
jgi:hypothetical protein